jgi:zinc/manganese transport system substrate-binding protein
MSAPRRGAVVAAAVLAALSGCGGAGTPSSAGGRLRVVAAENFWGSLAAQLGGDRVRVDSIVHNPNADPHSYEPSAADARRLADAQLAIVNGVGYDGWASKLLSASPTSGRTVLDVGKLVGVSTGGNPHRWYSPPDVRRVIARISAEYARLDATHAPVYAQRRRAFERTGLRPYTSAIARIRARYAGVPVGASESIFAPLAPALGLRLVTPAGFLNAVSEGVDPTARDKATVDRQIASRQIRVWVYNSQNATPDVTRLNSAARRAGIPIATVTETLTPAGASFQEWQVRELGELAAALARATGR